MADKLTPRKAWEQRWYLVMKAWIANHPRPRSRKDREKLKAWELAKAEYGQKWQRENPAPPLTAEEQAKADRLRALNKMLGGG